MKETIYTQWKNRSIQDIEGEIWKFIPDFAERYSVSNYGRIKSNKIISSLGNDKLFNICPIILKQYPNKLGYLCVQLTLNLKLKSFSVQRIVAKSFVLNENNYPQVNRIIKVRTYNHATNLVWGSKSDMSYRRYENINKEYDVVDIIKEEDSCYFNKKTIEGSSFIYLISDFNEIPIYIGKSSNPIIRFRQHKTCARNEKLCEMYDLNWLRDTMQLGEPSLKILKEVSITQDWQYWEKFYIKEFRDRGFKIFNKSDGGHDITLKAKDKLRSANEDRMLPVIQYSLDGSFVKKWDSIASATKLIGLAKPLIRRCIKKERKSAGGFMWVAQNGDTVPLSITPHHNPNHPNIIIKDGR